MSKLKLCPFCGKKPFYIEWVACVNPHCQMVNTYFVYETWNTRPIEDELRDRLNLAEAANAELQARIDAVDTAAWDKLKAELKELKEVRKDDIEAYNEQAAQIEDLNESLMIAYVDGVYEGRKSKESEIKRLQSELERYKKCFAEAEVENSRIKTAIQQCLTGNARLADGDNCGLAGPKQAMKE